MWLALALACTRPDDAHAYPTALAAVRAAPAQAAERCAPLVDPALRGDCVTAGAELLAATDASAAAALCDRAGEARHQDECRFQVAERSGDPARCADAGRFAEDCRMHLWSRWVHDAITPTLGPGAVESTARAQLAAYGFAPDDPRPWSALYRALLEARTPLDRAVCDAAAEPMLVESCRQTALAVYNDRLNRARDRLRWCPGAPVPDALAHTEDPDLEAMLLRRAEEELCQGSR